MFYKIYHLPKVHWMFSFRNGGFLLNPFCLNLPPAFLVKHKLKKNKNINFFCFFLFFLVYSLFSVLTQQYNNDSTVFWPNKLLPDVHLKWMYYTEPQIQIQLLLAVFSICRALPQNCPTTSHRWFWLTGISQGLCLTQVLAADIDSMKQQSKSGREFLRVVASARELMKNKYREGLV